MYESILTSAQARYKSKFGIMLCGHGSRSTAAVEQFSFVANQLSSYFPNIPLEYGYLEFSNPVIRDGLDRLRKRGCEHILAIPGMLFAAMHAKND
ncbi:MAG: CbiX/SirB N-terminal domain-containing protein, partial [Rhodospirillaceae bacterium]|nr:CbiX/SirB N-terminal domain-containing protein [Rhodospirillaceae bacterium]